MIVFNAVRFQGEKTLGWLFYIVLRRTGTERSGGAVAVAVVVVVVGAVTRFEPI